jgi:HAD superfamily hydrolase (TIGR01490 family)
LERLCAEIVGAASGHRQADVAAVAEAVAPEVVRRLYPGARLLLDMHRSAGHHLVLLSAGPEELVRAVSLHLDIGTPIGTVAEVEDGRYTGRLDGPFCHGPGKLDRLRTVLGPIELLHTTAYGDSHADLPVLRAVGTPVAVNPDRGLAAAAAAQRWPVVRFE